MQSQLNSDAAFMHAGAILLGQAAAVETDVNQARAD